MISSENILPLFKHISAELIIQKIIHSTLLPMDYMTKNKGKKYGQVSDS